MPPWREMAVELPRRSSVAPAPVLLLAEVLSRLSVPPCRTTKPEDWARSPEAPVRRTSDPVMVTAPVWVLLAVRARRPLPVTARLAAPETTPASVPLVLPEAVPATIWIVRVPEAPRFRLLVSVRVLSALAEPRIKLLPAAANEGVVPQVRLSSALPTTSKVTVESAVCAEKPPEPVHRTWPAPVPRARVVEAAFSSRTPPLSWRLEPEETLPRRAPPLISVAPV